MDGEETCRIEFSQDRSLYNYGDNYGAWLALSEYMGKDRIIEQVEVYPSGKAHDKSRETDRDFFNAGNVLLVELLMQDGWEVSVRNVEEQVTNMRRML
jgi:hypothetical protein